MTVNIGSANISSVQMAAAQTPSAPNSGFVRLHHNANSRLAMRPAAGNVVEFLGNTSGSGAGITFPNSASTSATTLDWYEEGTWTPVIVGVSTAGTASYTNTGGFFTRIGRVVHVQGVVTWSGHNGQGLMVISTLPFAANNSIGGRATATIYSRDMNWSGGTYLTGFVTGNDAAIQIYGLNDNAAWTSQLVQDATSGTMGISMVYVI